MPDPIRALIIEDSENDLILLLRALKKSGIEPEYRHVETLEDLRDAMKEQWDVVLADYRLEDFDGLDALRIVRQHDEEVPFILVSRTIGDERAVEAVQAGVQDYVLKENLVRLAPAILRETREARSRRHRRQAEEELLERTRQLQAVVDNTPDFIVRFDRDLRHLFVNRALCEAVGIPFEEYIGKTNEELGMEPEMVDFWNKNLRAVFASGKPRRMPFKFQTREGMRYFETLIAPEFVKDSKVQTLICNTRDLTREMRLQTQLRQAQKMEAVGQLAGGVAHDFNNLLQVITGNLELIIEDLQPETDFAENLYEISRAAKRATNLVRQLLVFSRREEIDRRELSLTDTLPQLLKLIRRVIGEHIEILYEADPVVRTVHADPGQIEQVLMNLCINARDAMPEGGHIRIELRNRSVTEDATTGAPGEYVCLRVADTGCGIADEIREHIFEPFFTTKSLGKGTGLGLATVYGIAQRHNGFVTFESEVDKGAAFEFHIPIFVPGSAEEVEDLPHDTPPIGTGQCILLAEDDQQVRRLARTILERGGYDVIEACDGEEAIALFRKSPAAFDLALIDVIMPKKNGDDVYRAIRDLRSHLPVLFATGYNDESLEERHLPRDSTPLISKPYSGKKLLAIVQKLLAG